MGMYKSLLYEKTKRDVCTACGGCVEQPQNRDNCEGVFYGKGVKELRSARQDISGSQK